MLVFEPGVSAVALWSMQHLHPHAASFFLQIFLGMMLLFRRSVTPVSVKNWNNLTESPRTSNHNRLVSQPWLAERREDAHSPFELEFDENQRSLSQYIRIAEAKSGIAANWVMVLTLPEPQEGVPLKRHKVLRMPVIMEDAADLEKALPEYRQGLAA